MSEQVDAVIVGAGASGSACAWAWSQGGTDRIRVLEAGPVLDQRPLGELPDSTRPHPAEVWSPAQLGTRVIRVPRGRGIGGSLAINGGYWLWANPEEVDRWDGDGCWNADDVVASYRALESDHDGHGPVGLERPEPTAVGQLLESATVRRGVERVVDVNASWGSGVGPLVMNTVDGERSTLRHELLSHVGTSGDLDLTAGATVTQVHIEDRQVVGVTYRDDVTGESHSIETQRVVLSAGSLRTPELLIRSGIGPRAVLDELEITCQVDAAPLGQRAWEHPVIEIPVQWTFAAGIDDAVAVGRHFGVVLHTEIAGQIVEFMPVLRPYEAQADEVLTTPMTGSLPLRITLMTPSSPSRLNWEIDPELLTTIRYGHLDQPDDLATMRAAIQDGLDLLDDMAAMAPEGIQLHVDQDWRAAFGGPDWQDHLRTEVDTAHHLMGTAPMGQPADAYSVVDPTGAVRGIGGLWIADASIIPAPLSRGPAATASMIGERIGRRMAQQSTGPQEP